MYFDKDLGHYVDVIRGLDVPLHVSENNNELQVQWLVYVPEEEEYDRETGEFDDGRRYARFADAAEFKAWLNEHKIVIPSAFLTAVDFSGMGEPIIWRASEQDILACPDKVYHAAWSLSHEHDSQLATFDSLTEAYNVISDSGARMSIPGNGGGISVGSCTVYSTRFRSSGIDAGDSHVDPTMATFYAPVFDKLLEQEKLSKTHQTDCSPT